MMEDGFCICTQRSDKGKNKIILNLRNVSLSALALQEQLGFRFISLQEE